MGDISKEFVKYLDGVSAELTQLRADNAELRRKHGLLATEVKLVREGEKFSAFDYAEQDMGAFIRAARAATDSSGAMEVGG